MIYNVSGDYPSKKHDSDTLRWKILGEMLFRSDYPEKLNFDFVEAQKLAKEIRAEAVEDPEAIAKMMDDIRRRLVGPRNVMVCCAKIQVLLMLNYLDIQTFFPGLLCSRLRQAGITFSTS